MSWSGDATSASTRRTSTPGRRGTSCAPTSSRRTAVVFSRPSYAPEWVDRRRLVVIPPAIDPLSIKNREMEPDLVRSVLAAANILDVPSPRVRPGFHREDGRPDLVRRPILALREGPLPTPDVPVRPAGVALGPAQGHAGRPGRLRRRRRGHRGPPDPGRSQRVRSHRRPRGPRRAGGVLEAVALAVDPAAQAGHARLPADGRRGGERVDRERPAAPRPRRGPEERRRGVRAHGQRGDVQGLAP